MGKHTKVSVLMSVYNTDANYLHESIDSVLNQSYRDFEFIIINDGSDEITTELLVDYSRKDRRIILIENETNLGLTKSLNIGLSKASGDYIARLDSDDTCKPERLEKQLAYMEKNADVMVLGCRVYDEKESSHMSIHIPWRWRKVQLITSNCGLVHSSAFIRHKFLREHNIRYDETKRRAQDYKLWADIATSGGRIEILDEELVMFRKHGDSISVKYKDEQDDSAIMISAEQLSKLLPDRKPIELYNLIMSIKEGCNPELEKQLKENLRQAVRNNKECEKNGSAIYDSRLLRYELMYLYNKHVGRQSWQSVGYWWYRVRRAMYKHI